MNLVLDHVFVLTEPGGAAAERLRDAGLAEGPPNRHPGQGTANRRFFFADAMLELLWVHDAAEAARGPARGLELPARSRPGASPFGLIFRRGRGGDRSLPFTGWPYRPRYLDADRYLHIGANSTNLREPLCVFMPFDLPAGAQPVRNPLRLAEVRVAVACDTLSEVLRTVDRVAGLTLESAPAPLMEITLSGWPQPRLDLRPALPLVVRPGR